MTVPESQVDALTRQVTELRVALEQMERQRDLLARRRRRHLLIVGAGISLLLHLALMYYLALQHRILPGRPVTQAIQYEFAIVQEEELTALETTDLEDLVPEVASEFDDLAEAEVSADLEPAIPAARLDVAGSGSMPTLGGSGEGSGGLGGLGGGGAGTTFFGVSSRGSRFAYIVDRSGSMGQSRKIDVALSELAHSIDTLPDYASFHVVLFSSDFIVPPMQKGWMRARKSVVNRFIRWLNGVDPTGGTEPLPAFHEVFALPVRPDVIFFLTDGQIPEETADLVADLNRRGGRVTINTIAFGDPTSQELLKRIARDSGGVYRFVPVEGQ